MPSRARDGDDGDPKKSRVPPFSQTSGMSVVSDALICSVLTDGLPACPCTTDTRVGHQKPSTSNLQHISPLPPADLSQSPPRPSALPRKPTYPAADVKLSGPPDKCTTWSSRQMSRIGRIQCCRKKHFSPRPARATRVNC